MGSSIICFTNQQVSLPKTADESKLCCYCLINFLNVLNEKVLDSLISSSVQSLILWWLSCVVFTARVAKSTKPYNMRWMMFIVNIFTVFFSWESYVLAAVRIIPFVSLCPLNNPVLFVWSVINAAGHNSTQSARLLPQCCFSTVNDQSKTDNQCLTSSATLNAG